MAKGSVCYYDSVNRHLVELRGSDFEEQLEEMKITVERMLTRMKSIGDYELEAFTAHVGVDCGNVVFKADGFFDMTWKKNSARKAIKQASISDR